MKPLRPLFALLGLTVTAVAADPSATVDRNPIVWDAMEKTAEAKAGEGAADFVFKATNTSSRPVTIISVHPSCGCTVVDLPAAPWVLAPGASGNLPATVDFSGKDGALTKSLFVESSAGAQTLLIHIKLPPADPEARAKNQALAKADRQAVFRGECASCHVIPGFRRTGEELFRGVCLNCHTTLERASMVPDLFSARGHRDAAWWRTWIT